MRSSYQVAIVGAGAAGLAAAKTLRARGIDHVVLEAAHRIGGRAYTEEVAPGVPFDLGAHFMHSGSVNPMVEIADSLGFHYERGLPRRRIHFGDRWATEVELGERDAYFARNLDLIDRAGRARRDVSVAEVTEREGPWTPEFDFMISLWSSFDPDQVSTLDMHNYTDTKEDWPLREGYGALIARWAADVPVEINTAVTEIDWSGKDVRLKTAKGEVRARKVVLTVSTGILGGGDIRFRPSLPDWKQAAIAALPLGNHNRICLVFDRDVFGADAPPVITVMRSNSEPMWFRIRPFGFDCAVGGTGGRFADWLERAGIEASADLALEHLKAAFGADIAKQLVRHNVTAWRGDPWTKGAYSSAQPGQAQQRDALARPIDDRLYFAGEAASPDFYSTVHGAYYSGIAAATAVADSLESAEA